MAATRQGGDGGTVPGTEPEPVRLRIPEIQGAGHVSPLVAASLPAFLAGQVPTDAPRVVTSGIVTAADGAGFFLQDAAGDGDPATSDAIFVATGGVPGVTVGQAVEVAGRVEERRPGGPEAGALPVTTLAAGSVEVLEPAVTIFPTRTWLGEGRRLPPTETIEDDGFARFEPARDGLDFWESLEGMLVGLPDARVVGPSDAAGALAITAPGAASGLSARGALAVSPRDFNPERLRLAADAEVSAGLAVPELPVGAALAGVIGVIAPEARGPVLLPTAPFRSAVPEIAERREITPLEGDPATLTLASYALGGLDATGGAEALALQILGNLRAPDILALQAGPGEATLAPLLDPLLAALDRADDGAENGSTPYAALALPEVDAPRAPPAAAFLYRADRVAAVDGSLAAIGAPAGGPAPALAAEFLFAGESVTAINARFAPREGGAPVMGVRQPYEALLEDPEVNAGVAARRAEAGAVNAAVDALLTEGRENVAVLGALAEHGFVSPVAEVLPGPGEALHDLAATLPPEERYTAIEDGNAAALDHALVSARLAVTARLDYVHLNAEVPAAARVAEHDPLIVAVQLGEAAPRIVAGTRFEDALVGTGGDDALGGLGSDDILAGSAGSDLMNGGAGRDTAAYAFARAEAALSPAPGGGTALAKPGGGSDRLVSIERLDLADGVLLLGPEAEGAALAYRLYLAALGRTPDEGGLLFHAARLAEGLPARPLAAAFADSLEFAERYGDAPEDEAFVEALYLNTLGREADAAGLGFWTDALEAGLPRAGALFAFADSAEMAARTAPLLEGGVFLPDPDADGDFIWG